MFNRCKLQRLVIEDSVEKAEESIASYAEDRTEAEILGRNEGNSDNTQISISDSSTTTYRDNSDFRNRRTDQTTKITQYYKFRGKRKE